ncbi:MAG: hypothetical protein QM765_47380 [Myxococcales bacterium]
MTAFNTAANKLMVVRLDTGRLDVRAVVYFEDAYCGGKAWIEKTGAVLVEGESTTRLFAPTFTKAQSFQAGSMIAMQGCISNSKSGTGYPVTEVTDPAYPYATPLEIVLQ